MRMTSAQYRRWPNKALTLIGMSGVGKTTLASRLPYHRWFHYSGDYRIGTRYLSEPIIDDIKHQMMQVPGLKSLLCSDSIYICNNITINNLAPLSRFIGNIGDPAKGGLRYGKFIERQQLHRKAEIQAMRDVVDFIRKAQQIYGYAHFVNDAGGSVCDLDDADTIALLAEHSIILYIEAYDSLEQEIIERHARAPKPMYYNEAFLQHRLQQYLQQYNLADEGQLDPQAFVRWVFPHLINYRRPLYQAIADRYGYTISAGCAEKITNEQAFDESICAALDQQQTTDQQQPMKGG